MNLNTNSMSFSFGSETPFTGFAAPTPKKQETTAAPPSTFANTGSSFTGFGAAKAPEPPKLFSFGTQSTGFNASPQKPLEFSQNTPMQNAPQFNPFGTPSATPSAQPPFGTQNPFGASTPFGSATPAATPFGSTSSVFSGGPSNNATNDSPFSNNRPTSSHGVFGATTTHPAPFAFGSNAPSPAGTPSFGPMAMPNAPPTINISTGSPFPTSNSTFAFGAGNTNTAPPNPFGQSLPQSPANPFAFSAAASANSPASPHAFGASGPPTPTGSESQLFVVGNSEPLNRDNRDQTRRVAALPRRRPPRR